MSDIKIFDWQNLMRASSTAGNRKSRTSSATSRSIDAGKPPARRSWPLIETDLMKTFAVIAEAGSFTAAAKVVGRTPSAVSMQVRRLEETLGAELFHREARSVRLTGAGEKLLGYARRMLKLSDEVASQFLSPPIEGVVSLGAPDDLATRFLPGILSRFAATHAQIDVNVMVGTGKELMCGIDNGQLDLTLVASGMCSSTDRGRTLLTEKLVWVRLKRGIAHERTPLPLALGREGCHLRANALTALEEIGRPYRSAYTSAHLLGQQAALLADLAIAPLPASIVQAPFEAIGPEEGLPSLGSYTIKLIRGSRKSEAIDALETHIRESFETLRTAAAGYRSLAD